MFTNEQIEKVKACKSVEEILALAKENDVTLTEEQAKQFFAELHKTGELTDEELEDAVGGMLARYFYICPYCRYRCDNRELFAAHIEKCQKSAGSISKSFV